MPYDKHRDYHAGHKRDERYFTRLAGSATTAIDRPERQTVHNAMSGHHAIGVIGEGRGGHNDTSLNTSAGKPVGAYRGHRNDGT